MFTPARRSLPLFLLPFTLTLVLLTQQGCFFVAGGAAAAGAGAAGYQYFNGNSEGDVAATPPAAIAAAERVFARYGVEVVELQHKRLDSGGVQWTLEGRAEGSGDNVRVQAEPVATVTDEDGQPIGGAGVGGVGGTRLSVRVTTMGERELSDPLFREIAAAAEASPNAMPTTPPAVDPEQPREAVEPTAPQPEREATQPETTERSLPEPVRDAERTDEEVYK